MAYFSDYSRVSSSDNSYYDGDIKFCSVPLRRWTRQHAPESYPEINLGQEIYRGLSEKSEDPRRTLIIPVNESLVKKVVRTYFEEGFVEAIKEAKNAQNASTSFISRLASCTLKVIEIANSIKLFFMPYWKSYGLESVEKFVETRDWKKSYIRYISWHPNVFKLAVAALDDSIRIYRHDISLVPVLKSWTQKHIMCMAWRPFCADELAVGCESGVLIWSIDPSLAATRPPTQIGRLIHEGHKYIISVDWHPTGELLATSSINDPSVLVWDPDQNRNHVLRRTMPPSSFIKWSPNMGYLFNATCDNVFRVWETRNFTPERWKTASGYIKSAVWAPDSSCLLFVHSNESILYRLQFTEEGLLISSSLPKQALPVADLSKVIVAEKEIGGLPQALAWDPLGHFLAVSFKDSSIVAIFTTTITKHNFNISPTSFIEGDGDEYPSFICFQNKYRDMLPNILTIGWSSGRVEFISVVNI